MLAVIIEYVVTLQYLFLAVLLLRSFWNDDAKPSRILEPLLIGAVVLHSAFFFDRWTSQSSDEFYFAGPHAAFSILAWVFFLLVLFIYVKKRIVSIAALLAPLGALAMFVSLMMPNVVRTTQPDFPHLTFAFHVVILFIGMASFSLATIAALFYLIRQRKLKRKDLKGLSISIPSLDLLDQLTFRSLVLGFLALTIGNTIGFKLAHQIWPGDWTRDPKVISSIVTWIWYVILLGIRIRLGWRGIRFFILIVIGFIFVLGTFLGFALIPNHPEIGFRSEWEILSSWI